MAGAKAFGEQNPTNGEDPVSWQTWSDGAAGAPWIKPYYCASRNCKPHEGAASVNEKPHSIVAVIGDTQIGGNTAITTPVFYKSTQRPNEKQEIHATVMQRWLFDCWAEYWEYVRYLAGVVGRRRKHRIIVIHLGDVIDGDHHNTNQILKEIPDQLDIAKDLLEPVADMADALYGIIGTEAHAGNSGGDEWDLYKTLGAKAIDYNLTLDIDGMLVNAFHHGRTGGRSWTSSAAAVAVETMIDCARVGMRPPDYIFYGHMHNVDDSGLRIEGTRAIGCPSWQLMTMHSHKVVGPKVRSDIGGLILNGRVLDDSRARYKAQPDGRKVLTV